MTSLAEVGYAYKMQIELIQIFIILGLVFTLLVWGRIRYDLVTFGPLILAATLGLVPTEDVFSGFGHSAFGSRHHCVGVDCEPWFIVFGGR